jgi:protein tyrosine/serine phosphatase
MKRLALIALAALMLAGCAANHPKDYIAHVDGLLYRGNRPADFKQLEQFGKIIDLEMESPAVEAEREYAKEHGIGFHHYPLSENPFVRPSADTLKAIVADIQHSQVPTLIHCLHGQDRTGYGVAAYRILVNGWTIDVAYQEMLDYGHAWGYYFYWRPALEGLK